MAEHSIVTSIHGFTVLRLRLPVLPSFPEPAFHFLYLRRHEPHVPTPTDERTLLAANVPIDATATHFRDLFRGIGGGLVERVRFDGDRATTDVAAATTTVPRPPPSTDGATASRAKTKKTRSRNKKRTRDDVDADADAAVSGELPDIWDRALHRSGSNALVVFVDHASRELSVKALARTGTKEAVVWGGGGAGDQTMPALGAHRYLAHHRLRYPPTSVLQASVDAYMTRYAAAEAQQTRQAKRLRQQPDQDGFVTVTRGGRTGPAPAAAAAAAAAGSAGAVVVGEKAKKKRSDDLKDFYRFQIREERKKAQAELLKNFADDRKKVDDMKRKRGRFQPE
ncbi:MAG: Ribosomal RNA-processing protein 7 [Phylliscum demangeonii]|nr:MAG: Ribosomal RNA-processing protein 7 [Phylliscum demangeonii]